MSIKCQKIEVETELKTLPFVKQIYPSDTNFLLVEVTDANYIYSELVKQRIIIRNRNKIINNCIRITIGTKNENQELLQALKNITL